ncbi:TonB-dependent receptor [Litorimonas sp. RW-G-Af-16]|uniref:TonB-dependent receptor n=1 Tax=Litorimonas sp. RW-G-Af-16 TaxID=3241168 RepID=UPI003AB08681
MAFAKLNVLRSRTKELADSVSEVLNAEDIGQLPERNIADAVQRLVGVNGNNDKGRSNQISLRGLGGAFTLTQVNDRQVASSFGSRSVNLDLYPSEVVGKAVIQKSASADQTEGGVGGSIDISTFRPLDLGNYGAVRAEAIYTPLSKSLVGDNGLGSRGSAVISRKFADDTIGVMLGVSTLRETLTAQRLTPGAYTISDFDGDGVGGDFGFGVVDEADGSIIPAPYYIKSEPSADINKRDAVFGSIQWRATDRLNLTFDALASSFKTDGPSPFLNYNIFFDADVTGTRQPNGTLAGFTSDSVGIEVYSGAQKARDKTYNFGLNADYQSDDWSINADVAYSRAPRTYVFPFAGISNNFFSQDVTVDFAGGDTAPNLTINDIDVTDPTGQDVSFIILAANEVSLEELKSAKFDVERRFDNSFITGFRFGGRYAERTKTTNINNQNLTPPEGGVSVADLLAPFPFEDLYGSYDSNITNDFLYFDAFAAVDAFGPQPENVQDAADLGSSYDLSEATSAIYFRADFAGDMGPIPFSGNFGVRGISTTVKSRGAQVDFIIDPDTNEVVGDPNSTFVPVEIENDYTNVLPSLNAAFNLTEDVILRTSVAKTIIRPDFLELRASANVNVGPIDLGNPIIGSRGNPELEPLESDQLDVSLEYYPSPGSYFAVAGFYKDIDAFYQQGGTANINPGGRQPAFVVVPEKAESAGGVVKGLEFSASYELSMLPGLLENITIYGNYTTIDIGLQQDFNPSPDFESFSIPLFMVEETFNLGAFYDDDRFTASINYYGQGASPQRDGDDRFLRRPFQLLSASLGYELTENVLLTLSGSNLLEESQDYGELGVDQQTSPNINQLYRTTPQGRSFFGGIRYQF